jgi:hypothetical protein
LRRGEERKEKTQRKEALSRFGNDVKNRIFQLTVHFGRQNLSHKLEDIVSRDVREKILKIRNRIEDEEQQWKQRKRKAKCHGASSLADVIFLELGEENPADLIEIFGRITPVEFPKQFCFSVKLDLQKSNISPDH